MAIALYLLSNFTEYSPLKLVIVGIPFFLLFITVFLFAFWWTKRRNNVAAPRVLHIISALVMFQVGILGTLFWYYVKDEAINYTSAVRYKEASCKIQIGMTKAEVIELLGPPTDIHLSKDEVELWWWRSHHRRKRPLTYKIIGKSVYDAEPFLFLSFDSSDRVATVDANLPWR